VSEDGIGLARDFFLLAGYRVERAALAAA